MTHDRTERRERAKLRNLRIKRDKCKSPMGIARLSGLVRGQQKLVDSMGAK